ncbi:TPA: DUF935 family protein, partial [Escherichia coli]|nr:DUF935 family protein [Escherichia coli]
LARSINRDLIYPLLALNSDSTIDINRLPGIVFDTSEAGDITALSDAIPKLAAGMRIPVSWIQEKLHIPQPVGDEAVFTVQPVVPDNGSQKEAALSADDIPQKDDIDRMSVSPEDWQRSVDPLLKPVILSVLKDGPEAAMNKAASLYPQMDDAELIDMLTRAIFVADIWGRLDAAADH